MNLHDHDHPVTETGPQALATQSPYGDSGTESGAAELLSGYEWNDLTLNYHFMSSTPGYYSPFDAEQLNFSAFNTQMKNATIRVLDEIETFTNITFTETGINSAQLAFGQARLDPNAGAWAYYPVSDPRGGDVWVNNLYAESQSPSEGNYGYYLLLHEVGHALGLRHSFEGLSGVEASSQYSVMAYDTSPYYPASYMLYDIKALQGLYGANMSYRTGNDSYVLDASRAYTVWDAGGTDTFNASHMTSNVVLNLNDGHYSSVGLSNNIAIAFGAVIENATGGSGNDKITGNEIANILTGNAGNDTFIASSGNDTINGGSNTDTVIYETNIENFLISIVNSVTLTLTDLLTDYDMDTLISVETYIFEGDSYSFSDLTFYANGTDPSGRPLRPPGSEFSLSPVSVNTLADSADVNLSVATAKTIGVAFQTGADISSRQVLFEQGGGLRGMSIYIEDGLLHHAAWNYRAGVQWGYKETTTAIDANTRYTTALLLETTSPSSGTLHLLLNGVDVNSVSGVGYVYPDGSSTIGIGMMQDQGRFPEGNVFGDIYNFTGTIDRVVYYNEALNAADLQQLHDHMEHNWLVNLAPLPEDDTFTILVDADTVFDVLDNDRDPNGDALDVISVTGAAHGDVTLNGDNTILYEPDSGYEGADSFTYTVRDPDGLTSTATVDITVTDEIVPDLPAGSVFALSTPIGVNTMADASNINLSVETARTIGIAFHTGADINTRQVLFEQGGGLRGMSIYIENGLLHHAAWNYRAGTEWGYKDITTAISANTNYTTTLLHETTSASQGILHLYLNGTEEASVSGVGYVYPDGSPTVGIGIMQDQGRFPDANVYGDIYQFTGTLEQVVYYDRALNAPDLADLHGNMESGWLVNVAPTPQNDTFAILVDTDTVLNVLANDSDPNGDTLDVVSVTNAAHGDVTLNLDNTILYQPDPGYTGSDSFTYTVRDPDGLSTVASVSLNVSNIVLADLPDGEIFELAPVTTDTMANMDGVNTTVATDRTIGISFETGADVASRQVIFEQGGGLRGMSIYIENGEIHHAAWNYRAGVQWGYKETTTAISANTSYTTTLVLDTTSPSQGELKLYLDGVMENSISGVGYVYPDGSSTIGIGIVQDQGRFPEANVYDGVYEFSGIINRIVYYDQVLSSSDLDDLHNYLEFAPVPFSPPQSALNIEDILVFEDTPLLHDPEETTTQASIDTPEEEPLYSAFTQENVPLIPDHPTEIL